MQTLHPVIKRGGLYWDQELLPRSVFEHRLQAVQAEIASSGDDAWVLYGDAMRYGDMAYVSHFLPRTRSAVALVPRDGPPTLLASVGARDIPASKELTWFDDVRPFTRLPDAFVKLLVERGFGRARIGTAGTRASLPVAEWTAIRHDLPNVEWHDRDDTLRRLRATKEDAAVAAVRRAAAAVQLGLESAAAALRAGESVRRVAALVDREVRRQGAEDVRLLVASGEQAGHALRPPDDRVLVEGDPFLLFVGAEVQRYWAEGAQTYVLGPATDELRVCANRAYDAARAMATAARPGAPVASLADAARERLGDRDLTASAESYGLGHGIGLDAHESPTIAAGAQGSVAARTILALHVVLHDGPLGAAAGQTVSVHERETRPLLDLVPLVECRAST
jgi:Xaa-Pro aminopeptidase